MTRLKDCDAIQEVVELLAHDGFDSLDETIRRIINEAMRLERMSGVVKILPISWFAYLKSYGTTFRTNQN